MELRHLSAFMAVAEQLNFSRAAASLYISQPALSYHINELERELGIKLFTRDSRSVYLTDMGSAILPEVRTIVNAAEELKIRVKSGMFQTEGKQRLRVSYERNFAMLDATGTVRKVLKFADENPDIVVDTLAIPFDKCAAALLEDSVDACFMVFRDKRNMDSRLETKTVFSDTMCLVYAESFGELSCEEIVEKLGLFHVIDQELENSHLRRCLADIGLNPKITRIGNRQSSLIYAEMGKCFSGMPEKQFEAIKIPGLRTTRINALNAEMHHKIAYRKENINPALKRLLEVFE